MPRVHNWRASPRLRRLPKVRAFFLRVSPALRVFPARRFPFPRRFAFSRRFEFSRSFAFFLALRFSWRFFFPGGSRFLAILAIPRGCNLCSGDSRVLATPTRPGEPCFGRTSTNFNSKSVPGSFGAPAPRRLVYFVTAVCLQVTGVSSTSRGLTFIPQNWPAWQ